MTGEIVQYILYALIGLGATITGIMMSFKKLKELFAKATSTLSATNDSTSNTNKCVAANTQAIKDLETKCDSLMGKLDERSKEIDAKFDERMAQINLLIEQLKPVINLPKAFAQTVLSNPDQIKNGTARKVNDILGYNDDNIQKHINNSEKKVGE